MVNMKMMWEDAARQKKGLLEMSKMTMKEWTAQYKSIHSAEPPLQKKASSKKKH